MANTLAYYDTATITAVKSFIVQAPGVNAITSKKSLYQQKLRLFIKKLFLSLFFERKKNKSRKSKQMIILSNGFFFGAMRLSIMTLGIRHIA